MSKAAYEAFEKAFQEMLDDTRKCGWCGKVFTSADILVLHIWDTHRKRFPTDGNYRALIKKINQPE